MTVIVSFGADEFDDNDSKNINLLYFSDFICGLYLLKLQQSDI